VDGYLFLVQYNQLAYWFCHFGDSEFYERFESENNVFEQQPTNLAGLVEKLFSEVDEFCLRCGGSTGCHFGFKNKTIVTGYAHGR
jgi:hypothetical protein